MTVNGQVALPGFDIFAAAGGAYKAVVRDVPTVADGTGAITVHFQGSAGSPDQNAKVSGIQVLPAAVSPPLSAVLSVNSGGGAVGSFSADTGFQGGTTTTTTSAVDTSAANAAPQAVYQSLRFGTFAYALTGLTPGASYTARLHFSENYWTGAGHRLFDVTVNGQAALSGFDIFAAAGGAYKAVVRDVPAVADGTGAITVHFQGSAGSPDQNAQVNGLQVLQAGGGTPTPPSAPTLSGSVSGQTASLTWTAPAGTVTGYGLYRSGDGGTTYAAIGGALPSSTTAYTDAGLSGGTNYLYYVVAVNGGGSSPHSNTLSLTTASTPVLTSIVVSPATASLNPNATQQFTATAKDQSGAALSPQPPFTWSLDSGGVGSVSGTGLYTAGAAGSATVRATSGTVSGTATATVTASADFSVSAIPAGLNIAQGSSKTSVISLTNTGGFSGSVTLAASGLPMGVTAAFAPASITGTATSTLTLTVGATAATGTSTTTITGTSGTVSHTATISLTVTANPILTSIAVSPASASLSLNGTQQFIATAKDQNGVALSPQPTFIWSVDSGGVGAITAGGSYSGGTTPGSATVRAASGGVSGTAAVTVTNAAPTVATAASASPNPVPGVSTALSVLGADDGGEPNLSYAWAVTGTPPAPVTFSANGTNAAKNTTATFTKAGTYVLQATITDASGLTAISAVTVTVAQTLTSIGVSPNPTTLNTNGTQQFAAASNDQFGNPLTLQPTFTWSVTSGGVGTISTTGLYTAGTTTGTATVQATSGTPAGSATVTVKSAGLAAPSLTAQSSNTNVNGTSTLGITLTWSAVAGATQYNLYRSTTQGAGGTTPYKTNVAQNNSGTLSTTYSEAVSTGSTYYYQVTTVNGTSEGPKSNEASATLAPAAPTSLSATAGSSGTALAWTAMPGAATYNLYRGTASGTEGASAYKTNLTGTGYTDTGTANGQPFFYKLTAVNAGGESTRSGEANATAVLSTVSGTAVYLSDLFLPKRIVVGWSALQNLYGPNGAGDPNGPTYTWTRYTDQTRTAASASGVATPPAASTALLASDAFPFVPGTTYYYGVTAKGQLLIPAPPNGSASLVPETVDLGGITVTPLQPSASDDQTADSRQDMRNSPTTNLNHNFGPTTYRGGLYAGLMTLNGDNSRVGRSFVKVPLTALPAGQSLWANVGNLFLYYTRSFDASPVSVQANPVSAAWSGPFLTWDNAPSLSMVNGAEAMTVQTDPTNPVSVWTRWHKYPDILGSLQGTPLLSYGLISTDETTNGWAYFAKSEYNAALSPCLLYGAGGYSVATATLDLQLSGPTGSVTYDSNGQEVMTGFQANGMLVLNRVAPPGGLVVNLSATGAGISTNQVTIPAGQFAAPFSVTGQPSAPTTGAPGSTSHGSTRFTIQASAPGLTTITRSYTTSW